MLSGGGVWQADTQGAGAQWAGFRSFWCSSIRKPGTSHRVILRLPTWNRCASWDRVAAWVLAPWCGHPMWFLGGSEAAVRTTVQFLWQTFGC